MKKIRTLSALIWCIGAYSLHAQTNDTMYIHQGQTVIKHAIKDVDSITFYLAEKEDPFLIVDETPIIATAEGGTYYIIVSSNGEWTTIVENSESWITLTTNNDTIVVDVDENTLFESRSAAVKISLGSLSKSVVVNQEAKEADCGEIDCWDFPVKPGTPEWFALSRLQQLNALQIPDSILPYLSTECLAVICSQYPLLYEVTLNDGWGNLIDEMRFNQFNGHGELFKREDAVAELLKIYDCEIQNLVVYDLWGTKQILAIEWLLSLISRKLDVTREEYITVLRSLTTGYEKYVDKGASSYDYNISINFYNRVRIILKIGHEGLTGTLLQDWERINIHDIWWDMGGNSIVRNYGSIINRLSYELIKEADCGEIDCWDFPVKPGMPEWAEVKDRRKALLIPDSILPCLSTECLAVICSQYPLFYDISGYDNWGNLVDEMRFNEFNGHGELFNREGAVVELLKIYDYEIQNLVELTFVMGHMQQVLSIEWLLSFFSRKLDVTRDEYITVLRSLVTGYEKYVDIGAHSYDISLNYYNRARIISKIGSEGLTGTLLRDWQWLNTYNTWWDMGARSLVRDCGSIINQLSYELIK